MTEEQVSELIDAVIECRRTSRATMTAEGSAEQLAADADDDAAFKGVMLMIRDLTK